MKHVINKNHVAMSSFALCLALVSPNLLAQESEVTGNHTTADDTISSSAPDQLVSATVTFPVDSGVWDCAVTASADTKNPMSGDDNRYIFGISEGSVLPASTQSGSDRVVEYDNILSTEETERVAVSTTYFFNNLPTTAGSNTHTFYWSARKSSNTNANMVVDDSSMTVVCSKF